MSEEANEVEARVGSDLKFSKVWLVPVVALVIGIWMIYSYWAGQGPIIEITFVSGEGIQAGTTKVRRKNVEVGEVLHTARPVNSSSAYSKATGNLNAHPAVARSPPCSSKPWLSRPRKPKKSAATYSTLWMTTRRPSIA